MRWTSILAIYFLFCALSFFLVLPFRLRNPGEDEPMVRGQAPSAPQRFSFGRTIRWTLMVAAVLFGIYYLNYTQGWIGLETFDISTYYPDKPE